MHRNLESFNLAVATFHDVNVSFYEAIGLRVVQAGGGMFKPIFICEVVPFFGVKRLSIVDGDFRSVPPGANSSVRWLVTAFMMVEPHLKQEGVFGEVTDNEKVPFAIPIHPGSTYLLPTATRDFVIYTEFC